MALLQGLTRKTECCTFQHFVEVFFILSVLMTKFPAHHLQKFPTQNLGALQSLKKQWILKWIKTFFWRMSQPQIISPSFRLGWVMQQHNDPKHNEINKCTHEWMKNKEICVFLCPDLNSVEMLWRKWTKTILITDLWGWIQSWSDVCYRKHLLEVELLKEEHCELLLHLFGDYKITIICLILV